MLPLSNSNMGRRLFFKYNPLERRIENTEAESVEDITDANNKDVNKLTPIDLKINQTITPVKIAVRKTPIVARISPCLIIG